MRKRMIRAAMIAVCLLFAGTASAATYDLTGTWNHTRTGNWAVGDQGCDPGPDTTGTCSINQTGDSFTFAYTSGETCSPPESCTFSGTINGATYTCSTTEIVDSEGGRATSTIVFTATSPDAATGTGTSMYSHPGGWVCQWGSIITLTRSGGGTPSAYTLTVNTVGSGTVTLNPPGGSYAPGTQVQLTAVSQSGSTFSGWSGDMTGSTNPTTLTMDANKTVTATFTSNDQDNDGIPDTEEDGGANNGDGNQDGTKDSEQSHVASLKTYDGWSYITIASPDGTALTAVKATANPSPSDAPTDIHFPYGFFGFTVTGVTGTGTTVTVHLPESAQSIGYYRYGPTPENGSDHWYDFSHDGETGAQINDNVITLNFQDGGRGDDDLVADGTIKDVGGPFAAGQAMNGFMVTSDLWIRAVIDTVEKGPVDAVWKKGGEDTTSRGDRVIWGHFYASPSDVTWGSENNPDLFVKIWFDVSGRIDVNYFHVSVPDIEVYSDYPYDGNADEQGTTTMSRRYIRQYYENGQTYSDESNEDGNPPSGYSPAGNPSGFSTINDLRIGSMINTVEKGPIDSVWRLGGQDTTSRGDQVVWGHFYASPSDVTWGSENNPDLFVKIWFDVGGRVDVNFFHVSVPDIEVYSDLPNDSTYDQKGTTVMDNRYIRHEYWR
jgi:Divergent InlB B-repeat domain